MNLAVTAIGRDRPGIVAAITSALLEAGGNVDDSQMSILHGHFAVMLIVSVPEDASLESLEARLAEVGREFELGGITVSPVEGLDRGAEPTHVLTGLIDEINRGRGACIYDTQRLAGSGTCGNHSQQTIDAELFRLQITGDHIRHAVGGLDEPDGHTQRIFDHCYEHCSVFRTDDTGHKHPVEFDLAIVDRGSECTASIVATTDHAPDISVEAVRDFPPRVPQINQQSGHTGPRTRRLTSPAWYSRRPDISSSSNAPEVVMPR